MEYKYLKIEEEGSIAVVSISRPEKRNALSVDLLEELYSLARELGVRTDIMVIIMTGGVEFFSAGVDLTDPKIMELFDAKLLKQRKMMEFGPKMCKAWEDVDQVTICAIEGFCIGGGVSIAASLDFRVMAESSYIRVPEVGLGLNMSWATIPRLVHLVGPARTKEIVILGENVRAKDAYEWGFAERLCPDGKAMDEAKRLAEKVAAKPPVPVAMTKQTVNALVTALDRTVSYMDTDQFILTIGSMDFKEGSSAFFEKRKPKFKGE